MTRNAYSSRKGIAALFIYLLTLTLSLRLGLWLPIFKDLSLAALATLALLISAAELGVLLALTIWLLNYQPAPSFALAVFTGLVILSWFTAQVARVKLRFLAPGVAALTILIFYASLGLKLFLVWPYLPVLSAVLGAILSSIIIEIWNYMGLPLEKTTRNSVSSF